MQIKYLQRHTPKEIPEWLILLNEKGAAGTKDVMKLFDYSSTRFLAAIGEGRFPKADHLTGDNRNTRPGFYKIQNLTIHKFPSLWKKQTILNEIKRRQKLLAEAINGEIK